MSVFLLTFLFINALSAYPAQRHSEYVSRLDPTKKFLPYSLFHDPTNLKPLGNDQELECKVRQLALQYANQIQPFRDQSATSDALNIDHYCATTKSNKKDKDHTHIYRQNKPINTATDYTCYIDPINGKDSNTGTVNSPFLTIYKGLQYLRSFKSNAANKQIIIRKGTVYLNSTINLSPNTFDNNLLIRSYPNENVTISGGILLKIDSLNWSQYDNKAANIWMAKLDPSITSKLFNNTILSLFTLTPHTRLTRARYPNGRVGVFSENHFLNPYWVTQWYLPDSGKQYEPDQIFKNLSDCSNPSVPCLNKSGMSQYDTYTAGYNKLCDQWFQPAGMTSYWCGANCAGGWADQDQRMATQGIRQLPIGMLYNKSELPEIAQFGDSMKTAIFYIHHSQGWNSFWWEIGEDFDLNKGYISFGKGGNQGGRVWTKTHDLNQKAVTNLPIMGGSWYIDNVFAALDVESEWFYDKNNSILYYWPNNTQHGESPVKTGIDLVIGNLAHLFELTSDNMNNPLMNVSFVDLSFRDTRYTFLDNWGTPSGGDWGLYNGGAFYLENTTKCSIESSTFNRLDGNCIALFGYNRNATFYRNDFGYIGDNIIGLWGKTKNDDGTDGQQPRYTNIIGNYVHDIGLYQLQSSLYFSAKSCLNNIYGNIVYNIPRAAILFNDAFGGGTQVVSNLIFNTCTQSGDHGPLNSWNRMPFLTKVAHGTPSYDAAYNNVSSNFVFANYGGSQSFDTDDGSAWHNIESNFFYDAMAYKNDYGGYNVRYINNINVALSGNNHNSWGIGPVNNNGPGNTIYNNKIIVYQCSSKTNCDTNGQIWSGGNLNGKGVLKLHNNNYYTPYGNASIQTDTSYDLKQMYAKYGLCEGSTANDVPSVDQIITWAKQLLDIN